MWKWFKCCKTAEEGKQLYRELVRKFHPDNGGTGDEIKEINNEFRLWWDRYKDIHINSAGETYTAEEGTTETAEEFMEIIRNLSNLSGIAVEMCGSWLWISGNTFPVREQLKDFGCQWSKGKKKWYWTAQKDFTKARYKAPTMGEIRYRYGSKNVTLSKQAMLA